jgi:hypothetical protein
MDEFEAFQRQIRPQIHDLCEKVDGMLQPLEVRASRSPKKKVGVGMGIYLYADGGSVKSRRAINRRIEKASPAGQRAGSRTRDPLRSI